MRRVVAYCKRHLAQEEKAKQDTDSKSYKYACRAHCMKVLLTSLAGA